MKKFLATILSILYMSGAIGATIHLHYCMGELADISFTQKVEDRCNKCGMKKSERNKGCCKDEYKTFKTNDHKLSKFTLACKDLQIDPIIKHYNYSLYEPVTYKFAYYSFNNYSPLILRTCAIYLKVCNFRI